MPDTISRYHLAARVLHWTMAAGFLFMWALGFTMTTWVEDDSALQTALVGLHISVGITLAALLVARIAVRLTITPPPLPEYLYPMERISARTAHTALYLLPPAVMALGWASVELGGDEVTWFGWEMPSLLAEGDDDLAEEMHKWLAYSMLAVALVHTAAAFRHKIEGRDVMDRML